MANYFEALRTDNSKIVIDDTFNNFRFLERRTITLTSHTAAGSFIYGYYADTSVASYNADQYLCAIRPTAGTNNVCYTCVQVSKGVFRIMCQDPRPNVTVDVYLYGLFTNSPVSGSFGLELYNAAGVQIYSSNAGYMTLAERVSYTRSDIGGGGGMTQSSPFGTKSYAFPVAVCIPTPFVGKGVVASSEVQPIRGICATGFNLQYDGSVNTLKLGWSDIDDYVTFDSRFVDVLYQQHNYLVIKV